MRTLRSVMLACLAVASTAVAAAGATESQYSGPADFQTFCASCHGATAKGDGTIAKFLPKRPPDLTQLAKRNNDAFPDDTVFKIIDGGAPGTSHSGADMPIWGDVFAKSVESAGPEAASARIRALVRHLETLQERR